MGDTERSGMRNLMEIGNRRYKEIWRRFKEDRRKSRQGYPRDIRDDQEGEIQWRYMEVYAKYREITDVRFRKVIERVVRDIERVERDTGKT
jgi:hypothetical protein